MIRRATIDDFRDISKMATLFYNEAGYEKRFGVPINEDSLIEFLVPFLVDSDKVALVDPGRGMIGGVVVPWFFNNDFKVAQEMAWYVYPEARGGRTGIALLKAFENWAKDNGAKIFSMASLNSVNKKKVNGIYRKQGMAPMEQYFWKGLETGA